MTREVPWEKDNPRKKSTHLTPRAKGGSKTAREARWSEVSQPGRQHAGRRKAGESQGAKNMTEFEQYPKYVTNGSDLLVNTLCTGVLATLTTTVAAAICGKKETGSALAPVNAVSHIMWADEAVTHDDASMRYTAIGLALNSAAVMSWAVVFEMLFGGARKDGDVAGALLGGVCVSCLAYITDYHLVPERLTPGFEKRLSNSSLFFIYAALAAGLGLGGSWRA